MSGFFAQGHDFRPRRRRSTLRGFGGLATFCAGCDWRSSSTDFGMVVGSSLDPELGTCDAITITLLA
jgi:hypothetical protein